MNNECTLRTEPEKHVGDLGCSARIGDTEYLAANTRWICHGTQQVERRRDAQLPPDGSSVAHSRVVARGKEEGEAMRDHRFGGLGWLKIDRDPQRLEHVRRAGRRCDSSVPMF